MGTKRLLAYFYILLACLIWGLAANVIKFTLKGIDPLPFLTYRFGISALVGVVFFLLNPRSFPRKLSLYPMIFIQNVLATTVGLGLLFLGVDKTSVLSLNLITLIAPIATVAAGVIFLKEQMSKKEKIGASIAFLGALFTIIEPILEGSSKEGQFLGNLFITGYLVADIASIILLKKLLKSQVSAIALANLSFIVGFLTILPIAMTFYSVSEVVSISTNLPLVYQLGVFYMAIFSGTLAYALRGHAQKTIKVEQAALFGYLVPLFSTPLAVLWLGEKITPLFIVGAVIVTIGVFMAEFKRRS